jgi:hypothetical protein
MNSLKEAYGQYFNFFNFALLHSEFYWFTHRQNSIKQVFMNFGSILNL